MQCQINYASLFSKGNKHNENGWLLSSTLLSGTDSIMSIYNQLVDGGYDGSIDEVNLVLIDITASIGPSVCFHHKIKLKEISCPAVLSIIN